MELNLIKRQQIVEKEGAFMPIVFLDLPAMFCTAALYKGSQQVAQNWNENRKKIVKSFQPLYKTSKVLTPLPATPQRLDAMCSSISDIVTF